MPSATIQPSTSERLSLWGVMRVSRALDIFHSLAVGRGQSRYSWKHRLIPRYSCEIHGRCPYYSRNPAPDFGPSTATRTSAMPFHENLRTLRLARGLTQPMLAE